MKSNNEMSTKEISAGQKAKGESGKHDCAVRAVATAFGVDYEAAHEFVEKNFNRESNKPTFAMQPTIDTMIEKRKSFKGKTFRKLKEEQYTNLYGRNLRRSTVGRFTEKNPEGTFIVLKNNHAFVVKDGVVLDQTREKSKIEIAYQVK